MPHPRPRCVGSGGRRGQRVGLGDMMPCDLIVCRPARGCVSTRLRSQLPGSIAPRLGHGRWGNLGQRAVRWSALGREASAMKHRKAWWSASIPSTQNPERHKSRVGSTPTSGTNKSIPLRHLPRSPLKTVPCAKTAVGQPWGNSRESAPRGQGGPSGPQPTCRCGPGGARGTLASGVSRAGATSGSAMRPRARLRCERPRASLGRQPLVRLKRGAVESREGRLHHPSSSGSGESVCLRSLTAAASTASSASTRDVRTCRGRNSAPAISVGTTAEPITTATRWEYWS